MAFSTPVILTGICVVGILCQWLAWRVRLPAILFLLLAGFLVGPIANWLDPDLLLGDLLFPFVSLSVALILFEGSLSLKFSEIRGLETIIYRMLTVGTLATWSVTAVAVHGLLDVPWDLAALFGAMTVVTGPTVIGPLLQTIRLKPSIAHVLRWEGILIDPLGALFAVLVFEWMAAVHGISDHDRPAVHALLILAKMLTAGILLGSVAGYGFGIILRRRWLPEHLQVMVTLGLVWSVFIGANLIEHEAGLLAVTVMGIWLANAKAVNLTEILSFKENLSLLLISALFIILAARIQLGQLQALGWEALGVLLAVQFVARPLKILISSWGTNLSWRERCLLAWVAPRGIVAAAVAALFALRLQQEGFQQADFLVPLTFTIIIGTVAFQSLTAPFLARRLGVIEEEPQGLLLIGANPVARNIAQALTAIGVTVMLADADWENIQKARMEGLRTYFGNPVSQYALDNLDLSGIGKVFALTPNSELNALACLRYQDIVGHGAAYALRTAEDSALSKRLVAFDHEPEQIPFGRRITYPRLLHWLERGAALHCTKLSDAFRYDDLLQRYRGRIIPMFALDPSNRVQVFTEARALTPDVGWTVIGLMPGKKRKAGNYAGDAPNAL